MPGRNSWNGKWSGDGHPHTLARDVSNAPCASLHGGTWFYCWPDGWRAEIHARLVPEGELPAPSHGFRGYDWMIASILEYGMIYADHERPETRGF
jgi:hypothetical protein